jgi:hypothetical protein
MSESNNKSLDELNDMAFWKKHAQKDHIIVHKHLLIWHHFTTC